ncbi:pyridoxamine 5'-phosphate oxidase family protein [Undibacterium sp. Di24W]|uniref:2Fe-2S iron-sulfur cluster-binding protein n=1 Tax=Undibacterium sp. Di24W TaxID=3413033 RepID=UPI003BF117AC
MPRAFATINFTPSVKAAQTRYHSREANMGFELADDARSDLTLREAEFIEARDSFYQATVNEDGWPYVQHRGGPIGFLKVLDKNTIGFADFSGNRQYLSVGNLQANERIAMILMDYREQRRIKIWGRVKIVHEHEAPELIARLEMPTYRARIERAFIITVEAWDWNCPQHITPRYTDADIEELLAPMQAEIAKLKQMQKSSDIAKTANAPNTTTVPAAGLGNGPLSLVVSGIRQLTPKIRAIELRDPQGADLPKVEAGAHLKLPVILSNGQSAIRHYSIASNPARRDIYEIAVLREDQGEGGSAFVHQHYQLGSLLHCELPRNDFRLLSSAQPVLLIAGGIGITAIKPMAQSLSASGTAFEMHYAAASQGDMALGDRLRRDLGVQLHCYFSDQGQRLAIDELLKNANKDSNIYVCGPSRLIDAVLEATKRYGFDEEQVHYEHFSATKTTENRPFNVVLKRSNKVIPIQANQTVLQALNDAGVDTLSDCGVGNCGTCAVKVLAGEVEHRDHALNAKQKQNNLMCVCVSRAHTDTITLDL